MKHTNKNLTVMFTDICGFTKQTGASSRSDLMNRLATHNAMLTPVIHQWGGTIIKSIGDAFLLTFESPTDALQCALCLQHTLRVYNINAQGPKQIQIKISVNCGEVTVTDTDVFGDPVNVAAKIEKATQANETYFTEAVFLSMNRSEVPCEFVSTFAAKGDEAPEIELYRIVMDEADPRYQEILAANTARSAVASALTQNVPAGNRANSLFHRYKKLAGFCAVAFVAAASTFALLKITGTGLSVTDTIEQAPTTSQPDSSQPIVTSTQAATLSAPPQTGNKTEPATQQPASSKTNQSATLEWAKSIVQDPEQLKSKSDAVIEKIAADFGEQTAQNEQAQSFLNAALLSRIYWEARNVSFEAAGELLKSYRSRFTWIRDWKTMEREQYLGSLYKFPRKQWRHKWDNAWVDHYSFLKTFADTDPDFGIRLATEISSINRLHNMIAAPQEQDLVSNAVKLKPALLQTERSTLLPLVQSWLKLRQENESFARNVVRKHFYKEMRPWLVSNLLVKNENRSPPEPDYEWRQNCLALLADKNDLEAIGNPAIYIQDNIPVFMRASETIRAGDGTVLKNVFLAPEHIQHVLKRPMSEEDRTSLINLLDGVLDDITSGKVLWVSNDDSRSTASAMKAELLAR